MSSFHIFWRRMLRDWRYQLKTFYSAADWTIWLYIILPSIVIFGFMYRSWWMGPAPGWMEWLPLQLFFVIGSLFIWHGSIRTYIDEADKVFLMKKENLFLNMKKWGFAYSIFYQTLLTMIATVILLPFMLRHYELTWLHALSFFFYVIGFKFFMMYFLFQLKKIERKTIRVIITLFIFILLCWFSFFISTFWIDGSFVILLFVSLVIGLLGLSLYALLLKKNSLFETELAAERDEKLKLVNMIYMTSMEIEKPKIYSRKKPWLFRNSYLIFKKRTAKNGFIELFTKVFVRNSSYVLTFFQMSSVTAVALIVVPPIWIKVVIFSGFLFVLWIWLEGTWERIVLSHPFAKKYHEHDAYFSARRTVIGALFSLSILFIGGIVGVGLWIVQLFSIFT